jgi:hypothetical protein
VARTAGDECDQESHDYELTLGDNQLLATACLPDAKGVHHRQQTASMRVDSSQRAKIDAELAKLHEGPMPSECGYDGPSRTLDVAQYEGSVSTYFDADDNCMHNANVRYLTSSLAPLDLVIAEIIVAGSAN